MNIALENEKRRTSESNVRLWRSIDPGALVLLVAGWGPKGPAFRMQLWT
jgi:hypothetical protein